MQTAHGSSSIKDRFISRITKRGHQPAQNNRDVGYGIVSLRVTAARLRGPPDFSTGVEERGRIGGGREGGRERLRDLEALKTELGEGLRTGLEHWESLSGSFPGA